jgi:23S rRNA (adenine2503-C2)-methyltransferase
MTAPLSLLDLTYEELQSLVTSWGEPAFRAGQIWDWLYRRLADSADVMTDLPRALRDRLAAEFACVRLAPRLDLLARDGSTRKVLFDLPDGKQIETVLMGYQARRTLCVSTQAGCGMGCPFCATGQGGLQRNLTGGEIVEQVLFFERELRRAEDGGLKDEGRKISDQRPKTNDERQATKRLSDDSTHRLTNLVFMGMGEPFANYDATIVALRRLTDPTGWSFGARRITVSTVGLIPGIQKFTLDGGQVNLAVSLHAATDDLRDRLAPINKRYPLRDLIAACRAYVEATHRRLSFEWALIDGVNDSLAQARALAQLARQLPKGLVHVNLIPLNPTRGYAGAASRRERIAAFRAELDRHGISHTLRLRRGIDIDAGCGQLRQAAQDAG